ncbi:MAG: enoyl-CoA hydratase/isomerase family protein [Deltaproteobacteria bacterium]|nr:enoyl-CoA hydratase/isomerase family protein [Deltaproteobacteria bacterium]
MVTYSITPAAGVNGETYIKTRISEVNPKSLLFEKKDGVAVITLNRPEKLNALNHRMRLEFLDLLDALAADDEVRVIVVTGAGRAFCAGADIGEFGKEDEESSQDHLIAIDTVRKIYEHEKPIIGAINGAAAGDGAQWMLAFDLNVASENAKLAWPATRLGLA